MIWSAPRSRPLSPARSRSRRARRRPLIRAAMRCWVRRSRSLPPGDCRQPARDSVPTRFIGPAGRDRCRAPCSCFATGLRSPAAIRRGGQRRESGPLHRRSLDCGRRWRHRDQGQNLAREHLELRPPHALRLPGLPLADRGDTHLNPAQAGSTVTPRFTLGGNQGLGILASGYPRSHRISCDSAATDLGDDAQTTGTLSYDKKSQRYDYAWKTSKAWRSPSPAASSFCG